MKRCLAFMLAFLLLTATIPVVSIGSDSPIATHDHFIQDELF